MSLKDTEQLTPNPYQAPRLGSSERGHARFRLRWWFAVTLYAALAFDLFAVWRFGFQPFIASAWIFFLAISFAAMRRKSAEISLDESGIQYTDLVQFVDVSWRRVERVVYRPSKTTIATESPLVQITISRKHKDYELLLKRIAEMTTKFNLDLSDFRPTESQSDDGD